MKKIVRKNQIVISALAVMIVVAGYLHYSDSYLENTSQTDLDEETSSYDLSEEDLMVMASGQASVSDADVFTDTEEDVQTIDAESVGEAVATSVPVEGGADLIAQATLSREQLRAQNKESLQEIIDNEALSSEAKEAAVSQMVELVDISEKEAAAELLLGAKGFTDTVVSITGDSADVVVNLTSLSEAQRAQIEDIVKRKTDISADKIVITTVASQ